MIGGVFEIKIETQLTRTERLALIERAIIEMEQHGYGDIKINFRNNQISGMSLNKPCLWGNTDSNWYGR